MIHAALWTDNPANGSFDEPLLNHELTTIYLLVNHYLTMNWPVLPLMNHELTINSPGSECCARMMGVPPGGLPQADLGSRTKPPSTKTMKHVGIQWFQLDMVNMVHTTWFPTHTGWSFWYWLFTGLDKQAFLPITVCPWIVYTLKIVYFHIKTPMDIPTRFQWFCWGARP